MRVRRSSSCDSSCPTSNTLDQVLLFGCWSNTTHLASITEDQKISLLQTVLDTEVESYIIIVFLSFYFECSQTANSTDLVEDGSAVAFLQQNGQILSTILEKTSEQRREEMETLIVSAFLQLKFLDLTGVDLTVMMEYAGILGDMQNIFLQNINTASTFDIARVCCRSLKLSKKMKFNQFKEEGLKCSRLDF